MANSDPTDGDLLADWLATRREGAFRLLVGRYAGLVHAAARRTCADDSLAAEVVQDTFVLLAKKAPLLAGRESLAGWLHLVAVKQAKNLRRNKQRELMKRERFAESAAAEEESTGAITAWREWRPVIDEALASLPDKDREAILLHFYRALDVGEISALLRIGPEAARKRIQRATGKLKAGLLRRGYAPGAAFLVALSAGFASDAQAALPVAMISMKATAATGPAGTALLTTSTAMKGLTLLPPVAALLVAGFWIASRKDAAARVEAENRALSLSIAERRGMRTAASTGDVGAREMGGFGNGKGGINWEAVSSSFSERNRVGVWGPIDSMSQVRLSYLLSKMTPEERLAQLELVDALQVAEQIKEELEQEIVLRLAWDKPALVLDHLAARLPGNSMTTHLITLAFSNVAKSDPAAAERWLDAQIAAGRFASTRLDGVNHQRVSLEAAMVGRLLKENFGAAEARIAALPRRQVADLLGHVGNGELSGAEKQEAYVRLVRTYVPEKEQLDLLKTQAEALAQDFSKVAGFLNRLEATPQERNTMMSAAGIRSIVNVACNRNVARQDLDKLREWVASQAPGDEDRVTGQALVGAVERGVKLGFGQALELAGQYESDEVMVALLDSGIARKNKERAREAAARIKDVERREMILRKLQ